MMGIVISDQCLCFLVSVLLGFCLGLFYEIFRFLRAAIRHNAFFCGIEDFFFCMTCTFCTILLCYAYASGVVRWFVLVGILLGGYLYFTSLGQLISHATEAILRTLRRLARLLLNIFCPPIKLINRLWRKTCACLKEKFILLNEAEKNRYNRKAQKRMLHFSSVQLKKMDHPKQKER